MVANGISLCHHCVVKGNCISSLFRSAQWSRTRYCIYASNSSSNRCDSAVQKMRVRDTTTVGTGRTPENRLSSATSCEWYSAWSASLRARTGSECYSSWLATRPLRHRRSPIVPACTQWSACISSGRPFRTPRDFPGLHSTTTASFCSSESRWRGWCRRNEIRCLGLSGIFRYGRISSNSFDDMLRKSTAYIFTDALLEIDIR